MSAAQTAPPHGSALVGTIPLQLCYASSLDTHSPINAEYFDISFLLTWLSDFFQSNNQFLNLSFKTQTIMDFSTIMEQVQSFINMVLRSVAPFLP